MSGGLLTLASGDLELVIASHIGGSIARFDLVGPQGRVPVLRGSEGAPGQVLDAASFPLVPFVNRVRGGRFTFRGREIRLAPNMAGDPNPLHGQGWLAPWHVEAASRTQALLSYSHEAGEWPWDYEARQHFRLDERGLGVSLACRNLSDEPMPCGLGQHPYFHCTDETLIDTEVSHVWTIDEHVLPVEKVAATGPFDLRERPVCGQDLDHGFGGWGGTASIRTPGLSFETIMSSPDAAFFQLYSPAEGGIFVAEPVTHANAAMNEPEEEWPELGLRILEPGEEMSLAMRVDVRRACGTAQPRKSRSTAHRASLASKESVKAGLLDGRAMRANPPSSPNCLMPIRAEVPPLNATARRSGRLSASAGRSLALCPRIAASRLPWREADATTSQSPTCASSKASSRAG